MGTSGATDRYYSAKRYFALVKEGLIAADDHSELLEGVIVAMPPQNPLHAGAIRRADRALRRALGPDVVVSSQLPFVAGSWSVPEPDFAVLPGRVEDYDAAHPTRALVVIEIADSSLVQDRLTKSRIYAHAGVAQYWIVNLRDRSVEWYADPDVDGRVYRAQGVARCMQRLSVAAFPDAVLHAGDFFPPE